MHQVSAIWLILIDQAMMIVFHNHVIVMNDEWRSGKAKGLRLTRSLYWQVFLMLFKWPSAIKWYGSNHREILRRMTSLTSYCYALIDEYELCKGALDGYKHETDDRDEKCRQNEDRLRRPSSQWRLSGGSCGVPSGSSTGGYWFQFSPKKSNLPCCRGLKHGRGCD